MKAKISHLLIVVFGLACGLSFADANDLSDKDPAESKTGGSKCWFWQLDCKAREALENLDKEGADRSTYDKLCRKGAASEGTFSLRSFNGRGCSLFSEWAAFYLAFCSKILSKDDFKNAQCYNRALEKLDFEAPEELNDDALKKLQTDSLEVIKDRISEHQGSALGVLKKVVCFVGGEYPILNLICGSNKDKKKTKTTDE